jgi:hypothetical protein
MLHALKEAFHSETAIDNLRFMDKGLNKKKGEVHTRWLKDGRWNGCTLRAVALGAFNERQMNKMMPYISQSFPVVIEAIQQATIMSNHVRTWHPLIETLENIEDDMGVGKEDE